MSSGVIIVPPVMKVFRPPRARRSPDARAAPTLRRDLRHAPLKRPCSRPGSYQRSSGVPVPGDNTPPDHRRQGRKVIPEPATRPRPSGPTKHGNGRDGPHGRNLARIHPRVQHVPAPLAHGPRHPPAARGARTARTRRRVHVLRRQGAHGRVPLGRRGGAGSAGTGTRSEGMATIHCVRPDGRQVAAAGGPLPVRPSDGVLGTRHLRGRRLGVRRRMGQGGGGSHAWCASNATTRGATKSSPATA